MNSFIIEIVEQLSRLTGVDEKEIEPLIVKPPQMEYGDYSVPCFFLAKKLKKKPEIIAKSLENKWVQSEKFGRVESKDSYLNFSVNRKLFLIEILKEISEKKIRYGSNNCGNSETILIDFSSPNIAKPFSVGNFRSTNIGNSIKKILQFNGFKVVGINHLGDWGTQFGKLIVAYKKWGNAEILKNSPVENLHALYTKFHKESKENPALIDEAREVFKRLENQDGELLELWQWFKELSLVEFKRIYNVLDIEFEHYLGESFYNNQTDNVFKLLDEKNLSRISENALIVDLSANGIPPILLKKSDGTTLYATRDIAAAIYRYENFKFAKLIYVVGGEQKLHFKQIFKVIELLGFEWSKDCIHVDFGLIKFENVKMSTREGNIIYLEDIINKLIELAKGIIVEKNPALANKNEVARDVAIGALKFFDLSSKRVKEINFSWEEILNFEGETGPYLQYTVVRIESLLKKYGKELPTSVDFSLLTDDFEFILTKRLSEFAWVVREAGKEYEPSIISNYLINLAKDFNRYYNKTRILGTNDATEVARVILCYNTQTVLKNGLRLLGIHCPLKM